MRDDANKKLLTRIVFIAIRGPVFITNNLSNDAQHIADYNAMVIAPSDKTSKKRKVVLPVLALYGQ